MHPGRPGGARLIHCVHRNLTRRKGPAPDTSSASASPALTALPTTSREINPSTVSRRPDQGCGRSRGRWCGRLQGTIGG